MEPVILKAFILTATSLTGLLCGASLDQSFKQLPARHVIGIKAFSEYAKAADLKNGVAWYAFLGIGSALTSLTTVILVMLYNVKGQNTSLYLAGVFAICHSVCTALAAPTYHKQKKVSNEEELRKLFNKFEFIQTIRSVFITLNFLAFIWAIAGIM